MRKTSHPSSSGYKMVKLGYLTPPTEISTKKGNFQQLPPSDIEWIMS